MKEVATAPAPTTAFRQLPDLGGGRVWSAGELGPVVWQREPAHPSGAADPQARETQNVRVGFCARLPTSRRINFRSAKTPIMFVCYDDDTGNVHVSDSRMEGSIPAVETRNEPALKSNEVDKAVRFGPARAFCFSNPYVS